MNMVYPSLIYLMSASVKLRRSNVNRYQRQLRAVSGGVAQCHDPRCCEAENGSFEPRFTDAARRMKVRCSTFMQMQSQA
jgi:hypothetical protein